MHSAGISFKVIIFQWVFLSAVFPQNSHLDRMNQELEKNAQGNSNAQWEELTEKNETTTPGVGITFPSMHYEFKIAQMNATTPINLNFNKRVEDHIYNFAVKRKSDFGNILGLSAYYFPIFEEMLDKYNLPLELKYLAVIESGLNPLAVSKSGAVGLWQFMLNSGKMFDLRINSYIDERRDPYKSTEAACKYLSYLYRVFNDWELVISAYNGGPGEVREAIYRSGGNTSLEKLIPFFPEQTKNYYAAFVAAFYVMEYAQDHAIPATKPPFMYYATDTLRIHRSVTFQQIEKNIDVSVEILRFLNPVYKRDEIPENELPARLTLPANKISEFLLLEERIYATGIEKTDYLAHVKKMSETQNKIKIEHVVSKGEFFHMIAMKYQCSIENIKTWNNLEDTFLYPGQKLIIWVDENLEL